MCKSTVPRSSISYDFHGFSLVLHVFFMIFHGFPRFWEPSPAELPSKLERVSELARIEDLEDFNRIFMNFLRIWSSAEAEPSSAEPERSSAEPGASSADVKNIEIAKVLRTEESAGSGMPCGRYPPPPP